MATAAVAAARRRRALTWPWPTAGARALAWLVVLGLLVALAAAALYVGARPPALVVGCPAGATPDNAGPSAQARPPLAYVHAMAFDSQAGKIVLHDTSTWTFDVCSNTWTRMFARHEPDTVAAHVAAMVYDVDSDATLAITTSGWMWAYDLSANSWTKKNPVPGALATSPRVVYDPVTGLVVVARPAGSSLGQPWLAWTYEVESDTWNAISQTGQPNPHDGQVIAYDGSVDRVIAYDGDWPATWLLDLRTGSWSAAAAHSPALRRDWARGQEMAYDASNHRTVAFSEGRLIAYDAVADAWATLADPPRDAAGLTAIGRPSIVFDSINERIVVTGSEYATADGWWLEDGVLAFDVTRREWITLLAPTGQVIPQ